MSPSTVTSVQFPIDRVVACTMNHFRRIYRNRPLFLLNQYVNRIQRAISILGTWNTEKEKGRERKFISFVTCNLIVFNGFASLRVSFHHIILQIENDKIFKFYYYFLHFFKLLLCAAAVFASPRTHACAYSKRVYLLHPRYRHRRSIIYFLIWLFNRPHA